MSGEKEVPIATPSANAPGVIGARSLIVPDAGTEAIAPSLAARRSVPVEESATWDQVKALGAYMARTEVHTYAFSVAAQVILSLFPFIVLLLTLSQKVFHSAKMADVVGEMMTNFLPNHQAYVMRNMRFLANSHAQERIFSVVMLLVTTTGVFLPLEVALNSVWGVTKNRSYLQNQIVSICLAVGVGMLAMASVALTSGQRTVMAWVFFGHTDNGFANFTGCEHWFVLPHLLGTAESKGAGCSRSSDRDRDGHSLDGGEVSLHSRAAASRLRLGLRAVRCIGESDDVGVYLWLAPAGRRLCLGHAAGAAGDARTRASGLSHHFAVKAFTTMSFGWLPAGSMVKSDGLPPLWFLITATSPDPESTTSSRCSSLPLQTQKVSASG